MGQRQMERWVKPRPKSTSWWVSIPLEADFCIEAVEEALVRHRTPPPPFTTFAAQRPFRAMDQGSQFASAEFIKDLASRKIKSSMDSKGAWRDDRFRRTAAAQHQIGGGRLHAYANVPEARGPMGRYLAFDNNRGPQYSLDGKNPGQAYFNMPRPQAVTA